LGVIIIVLFVGILLSFLVNIGVSAYLGSEDLVDEYYDGEDHPNIIISDFADTFYLSKKIRGNIIKVDYKLFNRLPTSEVLLGDGEFLFPTVDEETGYNYVADYFGELKPTDIELNRYFNGISDLTEEYREHGTEVYFIIIPNSQTVYPELMPDYMGNISENTRLKTVTRYLGKRAVQNYLDLTDALRNAKENGELYNNTEDSLNSRGAYYAYRAVINKLPSFIRKEITPVELNAGDLVHHTTAGKVLARKTSLENEIKNRTVSLSTDFVQKYQIYLSFEDYEYDMAYAKRNYKDELPTMPRIQFQFSSEWDKIIMIDYFSNTFGNTIYRTSPELNPTVIGKTDPAYVICFIHEKDLHMLADGSLLPE
ncbi:MAG: hypothetical protein IKJ04_03700, partial [Clostridia bacterium]|nr:hypothetical protein [Clostridia bacterium]